MKELLNYLRIELSTALSNVCVDRVHIGLTYTGVVLSTQHAGVAYTPIKELQKCPALVNAGKIAGTPASTIMKKATSLHLIERAIGLATVNALSQMVFQTYPEKYRFTNLDVLDLICSEDKVLTVGYFGPLIHRILQKTPHLYVLEKKKVEDNRVHIISQRAASSLASTTDVLIISGSTFVNNTFKQFLKFCKSVREAILLGPTASMVPQPLFEKGITAVMGIQITDPMKMLTVIGEGGGTRQLLSTCAKKTAFSQLRK